jgi:hypothetical protein
VISQLEVHADFLIVGAEVVYQVHYDVYLLLLQKSKIYYSRTLGGLILFV